MQQLALWRRVVFVDWHGVLSRDPFWISIRIRHLPGCGNRSRVAPWSRAAGGKIGSMGWCGL